jgi:hypothetical protein
MGDLIFVSVVVGFFAVATVLVTGCDRIVGRAAVTEEVRDR